MRRRRGACAALALMVLFIAACGQKPAQPPAAAGPEVSVLTVRAQEVPVVFEFVGQTESSQQVEIRARVNGFLEKRIYTEGAFVKSGQVMFLMDAKPLDAQLKAAQAELAQQQARLNTARANLARVKPLVADNALAIKDLDDATGQEQGAAAAVEAASAKVTDARLNLGYASIASPVTGLSSFAKVQDGAYVDPQNSLLTYVARLDPIRVNFSLSENESLRLRGELGKGLLRGAPNDNYEIELVLADGSSFPARGRITFADAAFSQETGTFLLRAELPNAQGVLRPGQFVRVRLHGLSRPAAIVIPQRAVQQGPKSSYVWVLDAQGKVVQRPVEAGDWLADQWLVSSGLKTGDKVVVDGFMRLAPGVAVRAREVPAEPLPMPQVSADAQTATAAGTLAAGGHAGQPLGAAVPARRAQASPSSPSPSVQAPSTVPAAPAAAPAGSMAAGAASVQPQAPNQEAVYFDTAHARIDATGRARLQAVAAALKAQPALRAELHGYVDASGDAQRNARLAKARAQAVRDALVAAGAPPGRIALQAPADIVGGSVPDLARRVDIVLEGAR